MQRLEEQYFHSSSGSSYPKCLHLQCVRTKNDCVPINSMWSFISLSHILQNNLKISASVLLLTAVHQTHPAIYTPSCDKKAHKLEQERDKNFEATRDNRQT